MGSETVFQQSTFSTCGCQEIQLNLVKLNLVKINLTASLKAGTLGLSAANGLKKSGHPPSNLREGLGGVRLEVQVGMQGTGGISSSAFIDGQVPTVL